MALAIILQILGFAGGVCSVVGFFIENTALMVAGLVVAFLFCKLSSGSIVEHILIRHIVLPVLALPGMFICRFAVKMGWGEGYLISLCGVFAIAAFLYIISVIKEAREDAKLKREVREKLKTARTRRDYEEEFEEEYVDD